MDYIRDHYKSIIFDIFKVRIKPTSEDSYVTAKKIINNLYNIFNNFDKIIKYDTQLYSPAIITREIFFNEFYIRFSITIALLNYNETYKISILKRLLI